MSERQGERESERERERERARERERERFLKMHRMRLLVHHYNLSAPTDSIISGLEPQICYPCQ